MPTRPFIERACDGLIWLSVGLSFAINLSMEKFEDTIEWQVTDGRSTDVLIPSEVFQLGYWLLIGAYLTAFWGIHANKRYGVICLLCAILLGLAYDAAFGLIISHQVTRTLVALDHLVLGALVVVALVRLNRTPIDSTQS